MKPPCRTEQIGIHGANALLGATRMKNAILNVSLTIAILTVFVAGMLFVELRRRLATQRLPQNRRQHMSGSVPEGTLSA
jgi:hypothetical protein